jgi:hypothetical protein
MSLGIIFKGPEGIVLAADSRVTLTHQMRQPNGTIALIPSTYDNATKLLRVKGQDHVGAVTYGVGAIGQGEPRTAHSYIPELEQELSGTERLSVREFAEKLSTFFQDQWNAHNMPPDLGQDMVFLVGGYDEGAPYGRVFEVHIPSRPEPFEWHNTTGSFGLVWGGQSEYVHRIIHGFDGTVPEHVKNFLSLDDSKKEDLRQYLLTCVQAPVPYAFLPLQDSVDLAIFLIRMTITMQHKILGVRGVGGAIDVAVITQAEGFKEIQRKKIIGEELWE